MQAAYVDNPFYDPLDPAVVEGLGQPVTRGDSAQFDVRGGARAVWRALRAGRLEATLRGRWSIWRGDAMTSGWDAGLGLSWIHQVGQGIDLFAEASGVAAAIAAFPDDDLRWLEGRLGATLRLGAHRLEGAVGAALRGMPERVVDPETGATGLEDRLFRGRLAARFAPRADLTVEPAYTVDLSRTDVGVVEHDTHALGVRGGLALGPVDLEAEGAGWLRAFAPRADGAGRLDQGVAVEVGVGRTLWPGVRISGRYRYVRSTSDDPFGQYAQQFAGVELLAWYDGRAAPVELTPQVSDAAPTPDDAGWRFRHRAPDARQVALVGDFNDWAVDRNPLEGPDGDGWWSVTIPLEPGRHSYMFVVDGERFVRPEGAPRYADDGFGGEVGVIFVMPEAEVRAGR